ncbi:MAG TPA: hypothetical protein VLE95_01955 [Chlamydiales bacterium]|nr:hypothetical protein [Chlamydiales bacterium]
MNDVCSYFKQNNYFDGLFKEKIKEEGPINIDDEILNLFQQNVLLARATENEILRDETIKFDCHKREIKGMQSDRKLRNASATLLVPGECVATYKPYGFLFNGISSEIVHIAPHDICSGTDNAVNLSINTLAA